jgi:hypothetical protein
MIKQEDLRYAEQKLQEMEADMIKENKDRLCFQETHGSDGDEHQKLLVDIDQQLCSCYKFIPLPSIQCITGRGL